MTAPYTDINDLHRAEGDEGVRQYMDEDFARSQQRADALPDEGPGEDFWDTGAGADPQGDPDWVREARSEPRFVMFDPTAWQDQPVPQRKWLCKDLVPARNVTEGDGDGGVGKSTLYMQLLVACATGRKWIGRDVTQCRSLYLACEDDMEELHIRLRSILDYYMIDFKDLADFRLVSMAGEDAVLAKPPVEKGAPLDMTGIYRRLLAGIAQFKPGLVVLDTKADLFGGDQNDPLQARQFITTLRKVAMSHDLAIILLSHPSLSGMASGRGGSGTVAWRNSSRSALLFQRVLSEGQDGKSMVETDTNLRTLYSKKNNYGPTGGLIALRYVDGVFEPADNATPAWLDKKAGEARAEAVFLDLLTTYWAQERYVSDKVGTNYAPALFAGEKKAVGFAKSALGNAMKRLFAADKIKLVWVGSGTRAKQVLAVSDAVQTSCRPED